MSDTAHMVSEGSFLVDLANKRDCLIFSSLRSTTLMCAGSDPPIASGFRPSARHPADSLEAAYVYRGLSAPSPPLESTPSARPRAPYRLSANFTCICWCDKKYLLFLLGAFSPTARVKGRSPVPLVNSIIIIFICHMLAFLLVII